MADIEGRDDEEKELSKEVAGALQDQLDAVMEAFGNSPDIDDLDDDFWDAQRVALSAVLFPALQQIYMNTATAQAEATPIGADIGELNNDAAEWARNYTFDLVSGLNATTQSVLQKQVAAFFDDGLTIGQLRDNLTSAFGPVRADMIATTEVTRAAVEGEMGTVEQLRGEGAEMEATWVTSMDERVCPICQPRDGRKQGDGWEDPPPAHPRCRCWLNWEFKGAS